MVGKVGDAGDHAIQLDLFDLARVPQLFQPAVRFLGEPIA